MKYLATTSFQKKFRQLVKKNPMLGKDLDRKFVLFRKSPNHPSLRLHKLSGKHVEEWNILIKARPEDSIPVHRGSDRDGRYRDA